jgi:hypothetical protein
MDPGGVLRKGTGALLLLDLFTSCEISAGLILPAGSFAKAAAIAE